MVLKALVEGQSDGRKSVAVSAERVQGVARITVEGPLAQRQGRSVCCRGDIHACPRQGRAEVGGEEGRAGSPVAGVACGLAVLLHVRVGVCRPDDSERLVCRRRRREGDGRKKRGMEGEGGRGVVVRWMKIAALRS
jgi:hypothetical protein